MELYLDLSIPDKPEKEKCSIFLYLIGQTGRDIYSTMTLADEEKDKIGVLFKKFEEHCLAQQNVTMERYRFHMRCQRKDETVSQFVTALKLLAASCKFGELMNDMIKDRIVALNVSKRDY